ncbi:hypothetical protein MBGDN05_00621 [Thermoplasmatales archaeon SCGC AB-539-N05]|nr:hypothetical protein MBGDN05_00621 [Thermoplasmatales archaeon SCGC AB-539-N05]
MIVWTYIIKGDNGIITTKNCHYAKQKSKHGYFVFCKRETNIYKRDC